MKEIYRAKDPVFGMEYIILSNGTEKLFVERMGGEVTKYFPYDEDRTPASVNTEILRYTREELLVDDNGHPIENPTHEELVDAAKDNLVCCSKDGEILSLEYWGITDWDQRLLIDISKGV